MKRADMTRAQWLLTVLHTHYHARWTVWRRWSERGRQAEWVWCSCDNLHCVLERVRQRRHYTQHAVSQGCAASIREQLEVLDARGIVTATEEDPVLPCGDDGSLRIHTPHPEI